MTLVTIDIKNIASETHPDDRVVFYSPANRNAQGTIVSTAMVEVPLVDGVGEKDLAPGAVAVRIECRGVTDTRTKAGYIPEVPSISLSDVILEWTPALVDQGVTLLLVALEQALETVRDAVDSAVDDALGESSANLLDPSTVSTGTGIDPATGNPLTSAAQSLSGWIVSEPNEPFYVSGYEGKTYRYAAYGADRGLLSTAAPLAPSGFTTPAGTAWIRVSVPTADLGTVMINRGTVALPWEEYRRGTIDPDKLPNELWFDLSPADIGAQPAGDYLSGLVTPDRTSFFEGNTSTNLFNKDTVENGWVLPEGSGTPTENDRHALSAPIEIVGGGTYTSFRPIRASFFANEVFLSSQTMTSGDEVQTWQAPAGATHVRLTLFVGYLETAQLNAGSTLLPYEPGMEAELKIPARYLDIDAVPSESVVGKFDGLVDTAGLGEVFTAPTIDAQPGLSTVPAGTVYGWWDQLATDYPEYVTRRDLGLSSDGVTPLLAFILRPEEVPSYYTGTVLESLKRPLPTALLMAGTHGYEETGPWCLWRLAQALCTEWDSSPVLEAMRWNFELIFIPLVNPVGWDKPTTGEKRKNHNGVDLARNFSAGWQTSDPTSGTYGGTAPLSEPETQAIDALMAEISDRCVFGGSFHNFSNDASTPWRMLWQAAASPMMLNLGKKLVSRMSRKWREEQTWITIPDTYFGYSDMGAPPGSEGQALVSHGIPGSTFETSQWCYLDGTAGVKYDTRVMTLSYEAVVNYVAMGLAEGLKFKA